MTCRRFLGPTQVDAGLKKLEKLKAEHSEDPQAACATMDVTASTSEGLRLRSEMQRAAEQERYWPRVFGFLEGVEVTCSFVDKSSLCEAAGPAVYINLMPTRACI